MIRGKFFCKVISVFFQLGGNKKVVALLKDYYHRLWGVLLPFSELREVDCNHLNSVSKTIFFLYLFQISTNKRSQQIKVPPVETILLWASLSIDCQKWYGWNDPSWTASYHGFAQFDDSKCPQDASIYGFNCQCCGAEGPSKGVCVSGDQVSWSWRKYLVSFSFELIWRITRWQDTANTSSNFIHLKDCILMISFCLVPRHQPQFLIDPRFVLKWYWTTSHKTNL